MHPCSNFSDFFFLHTSIWGSATKDVKKYQGHQCLRCKVKTKMYKGSLH